MRSTAESADLHDWMLKSVGRGQSSDSWTTSSGFRRMKIRIYGCGKIEYRKPVAKIDFKFYFMSVNEAVFEKLVTGSHFGIFRIFSRSGFS